LFALDDDVEEPLPALDAVDALDPPEVPLEAPPDEPPPELGPLVSTAV
jgi:hypothetical protein